MAGPVLSSNVTVGCPATGATAVPSALARGVPTDRTSATTTRLSVAPMPAAVWPAVPKASTGGMAKRMREPDLTPVSALLSPGIVWPLPRTKDCDPAFS